MEEIITGIIKGTGLLIRACIESGAWEASIRKPEKFLLKIIWPHFWFTPILYSGPFLTLSGIIFWCVITYAYYYLFKITGL